MAVALALAGASAGLSILGGLFGYLEAQEAAEVSESRGRVLRMEADADAERYGEQAHQFKATQKLAFLKSGVTLSGSPLDILDETARVSQENINDIRARGEAQQADANTEASSFRAKGRAALLSGFTGAAQTAASASYASSKNSTMPTGTSRRTGLPGAQ